LFETPGLEPGTTQEKKGSKKAIEGRAQLQAGAGNEIGPATAFQVVSRIDFMEPLLASPGSFSKQTGASGKNTRLMASEREG
jgi:hypothetical protein